MDRGISNSGGMLTWTKNIKNKGRCKIRCGAECLQHAPQFHTPILTCSFANCGGSEARCCQVSPPDQKTFASLRLTYPINTVVLKFMKNY